MAAWCTHHAPKPHRSRFYSRKMPTMNENRSHVALKPEYMLVEDIEGRGLGGLPRTCEWPVWAILELVDLMVLPCCPDFVEIGQTTVLK